MKDADRRFKPLPADVDLVPPEEFEREAAILFQVPPAEADAVEAARLKRPSPKAKKKAS
jgi:hypothetical protein